MPVKLTLGTRIRTRRVLCWLSQDEFARRVGVSRRQVGYWESDHDAPSAESICHICLVLNISADWLLTGKGWLREVHSPAFYRQSKDAHLSRFRALVLKVPLFNSLPLDFHGEAAEYAVSDEDQGAIALAIGSDEFNPVYREGDVLLLQPVELHLGPAASSPADSAQLASLDQKHAAVILNGKGSIAELELEAAPEQTVKVSIRAVAARSGRAHRAQMLQPSDDLRIQAVIYKCVRPV